MPTLPPNGPRSRGKYPTFVCVTSMNPAFKEGSKPIPSIFEGVVWLTSAMGQVKLLPAFASAADSNLCVGVAVPIPTLGGLVPNWQLVQPSTSALLSPTVAKAPIAVALVRLLAVTSAPKPEAVFLLPVELVTSAASPLAVLKKPVLFELSALKPVAVLSWPRVLLLSAPSPVAVLREPLVLEMSALTPMAVLELPPAL